MPDSLLHIGPAESFLRHASEKATETVASFEVVLHDKALKLDGVERPCAYSSGLDTVPLTRNGLQFPNCISSQLKGTVCRACLRVWRTVPCSYCTKTVVEHGRRRAQLLAFIARQATSVDFELPGKRGFRHIATGHLDQLSLRSRKSFNRHLLNCYKCTLCYSSTIELKPTFIIRSANILMSMESTLTQTLPDTEAMVERTLSRP